LLITRILDHAAWANFQATGQYEPPALFQEGSIWCTTPKTVAAVATMLFRGREDLVLLCLDARRLQAPVEWRPYEGELYPHVLGPIHLGAVVAAVPWAAGPDGSFTLPALPTLA
jgi:uncharacterized protein (DUF952 family)